MKHTVFSIPLLSWTKNICIVSLSTITKQNAKVQKTIGYPQIHHLSMYLNWNIATSPHSLNKTNWPYRIWRLGQSCINAFLLSARCLEEMHLPRNLGDSGHRWCNQWDLTTTQDNQGNIILLWVIKCTFIRCICVNQWDVTNGIWQNPGSIWRDLQTIDWIG